MNRPTIALVIDRPPAPGLVTAAVALGEIGRLAVSPGEASVAALCSSATSARGRPQPAAAWFEPGDDTDGLEGLLLHDAGVVPPRPGVAVMGSLDFTGRRLLSPFVRSCWRRREGLPPGLVVVVGPETCHVDGGAKVPAVGVPAALATAAALVATGPQLAEALAWGAPTVTTPEDADLIGALDGVHVTVASDRESCLAAARTLAMDWPRAAAQGRVGRRFAEERFDRDRWLTPLVTHLGLAPRRPEAGRRVAAQLAQLQTPAGAVIVDRASFAVAGLR